VFVFVDNCLVLWITRLVHTIFSVSLKASTFPHFPHVLTIKIHLLSCIELSHLNHHASLPVFSIISNHFLNFATRLCLASILWKTHVRFTHFQNILFMATQNSHNYLLISLGPCYFISQHRIDIKKVKR
jgi:hypothetical protein